MELPPKPELEYRERVGNYGEIVEELTPKAEIIWAEYLRKLHIAERAIWLEENEAS